VAAAAPVAAAAVDAGDDDDNDAFQETEIKRYVPILSTPRDVYTPEDEEQERKDRAMSTAPPGWCPMLKLYVPGDYDWKEMLNSFVPTYPDFVNSVDWAKTVQDAYEKNVLTPHLDELVLNSPIDPVTGEIKTIDPTFVQTLFVWHLRDILKYFREQSSHRVIKIADELFEERQLRAAVARSAVLFQMVQVPPGGVPPPIDPSDPPMQIDFRGLKAYIDVAKQASKTTEQLQAALNDTQ